MTTTRHELSLHQNALIVASLKSMRTALRVAHTLSPPGSPAGGELAIQLQRCETLIDLFEAYNTIYLELGD
jgi:hypothetical protein